MKIAIHAIDSKRFNLALGKIAAFHKDAGDSVEWFSPIERYDIYYGSKIFNFTEDFRYLINAELIVKGGTGYDLHSALADEIDGLQPDYSIYPSVDRRTSYGFLTRGCPNKCKWCVVPEKEGKVRPYMGIDEITQGGRRPYAVLMDNNVLASEDWGLPQIEEIAERKYHVDFNQALDARLVTPEIAQLLARCKWIGSIVRFGCDTPAQVKDCERAISLMQGFGYTGQFLLYTMLHGSISECYERLTYWKMSGFAKKIRLVAQPFRDPRQTGAAVPKWQQDMARWAMRRELYASMDFKDYQPRKGFACKEYFKIK